MRLFRSKLYIHILSGNGNTKLLSMLFARTLHSNLIRYNYIFYSQVCNEIDQNFDDIQFSETTSPLFTLLSNQVSKKWNGIKMA